MKTAGSDGISVDVIRCGAHALCGFGAVDFHGLCPGALELLDAQVVVGAIADGNYVLRIGFATLSGSGNFGLRCCGGGSEAHHGDADKDSMHTSLPPAKF